MTNVTHALRSVQARIAAAARQYGRVPADIRLVAVSKTRPAEDVRAAMAAGQRDFGENYLQEALPKIKALEDRRPCWHFIGRIQSNKTRPIANHFDWVHTVDRRRIAERLSEQRGHYQPPLRICLQVRLVEDESRPGVPPAELPALAEAVAALPRLELRGLMCMPPPEEDFDRQRAHFHVVRECLATLRERGLPCDTLSMGTTGDLEAAIAEGANLVRVGTAVFGPRDTA